MGSTSARSAAREHVVVLAGGETVDPARVPTLPSPATVIAADGGLAWAAPLGLVVDDVVGDMDSVDPHDLEAAELAGARIDRHPADKDRTDLAIALDLALERGPARVVVVGGYGGRLDHQLANLLLLASPAYTPLDIIAYMGDATVTVIHGSASIDGAAGETLSLLPLHGPARRVTTQGLRFPLRDEDLPTGSSRGVSNTFLTDRASVRVGAGVLVAVRPGHHG